jgi:hypothetical protein
VLELATDLRLLDKPPYELGLAFVPFKQDLDGQLAAEVDVATTQDRAHPAPGNLSEKLVSVRAIGGIRDLRRAGLEDGTRAGLDLAVVKQNARHRADGLGKSREHAGATGLERQAHFGTIRLQGSGVGLGGQGLLH